MAKKTLVNINGVWRNVKTAWLNVSGVWKKVTPKGNRNDLWKEFIQYTLTLYSYGASNTTFSGSRFLQATDHLQINIESRFSGTTAGLFATDEMIDLTDYQKITFITELSTTNVMNNVNRVLGVSTSKTSSGFDARISRSFYNTRGEQRTTYTLDISDLSGMYYIKAYVSDGHSENMTTLRVYKIEFE